MKQNNESLLTCLILTYNEEKHILRCLNSLLTLNSRIVIIDSFSTDHTIEIARSKGAEVYQNKFVNHAKQIQWGLDNCNIQSTWVFRLDADEYTSTELVNNLIDNLLKAKTTVSGILLKRRVYFMGRWIKRGGYYPIWILRVWKNGYAVVEQRWMDEYIKVISGDTIQFEDDFIEENLNNLSWWTIKHNHYSNREVADLINRKNNNSLELENHNRKSLQLKNQWSKWNIYYKLPLLLRPFLYFFYRYFLKMGFLDGKEGLIWHLLQGFWYRFLVDAKYMQLQYLAKKHDEPIEMILQREFEIQIKED